MAKDRFLVTAHTAIIIAILVVFCSSCSLPRIMILRDPLTPEEHINLGVSYEKNNELDAALKEYEAASKGMPIAYLYAGNIYFQKKIYEEAESNYRIAISKTKDPRAYNNLAWLYYVQGTNLEDAEGLALKAIELSPDSQEFKDTLEKIAEKRREKL
jgi:tetratricopeptide (TPR) repeat protein